MKKPVSTDTRTSASVKRATPVKCCFEDEDGRRVCRRGQYEMLNNRGYCVEHVAVMRQRAIDEAAAGTGAARRWGNLSPALLAQYNELVSDPALLDPRNPLALHRALLNELVVPSDDLVERTAYSIALSDWSIEAPPEARIHCKAGGELLQESPTMDDIRPHHREQARRRLTKEAIGFLTKFQFAVMEAAKIGKIDDMLMLRVLPIIQSFGSAVGVAAEEFVGDPRARGLLLDAVRRAAERVAGEITSLAAELKR